MGFVAAVVGGATIAEAVAAVTVTTVLEAVAVTGAVLGAVGAITGNKDLSYVGLALGIVGGVGSLAVSAGVFGADAGTASLFGTSTAASTADAAAAGAGAATDVSAADAAAAGAGAISPADAALQVASNTTPDIVNSVTGSVDADPLDVSSAQAQSLAGGAGNPLNAGVEAQSPNLSSVMGSPTGVGPVGDASPSALPPQPIQRAGQIPGSADGMPSPATPTTPAVAAPAAPATPGGVSADTKALLAGMSDITFKQAVISGAIQAGGSLLSGLTNPVTPAQVNALNAQAAANQAATQLSLTQQADMAQAKPVATLGTPPGLINSQGATT